ncbi:zinc ribbon domain-containing protein [Erwinia tracheiphila]|uniref:Primosomal protein N' (Replication factor Y)-superfamily II helicase n=1 Tax=Erwinia tracheiphila TaxID=65700 RepID=A0A345CNI9_9GAMM|nr:zinc ribbon domain-containing protein [Erwinia tracheiphila]AXF75006.1 primosomal protein N' (replication factor Y) - superfamily II helicase [Erwinia tracheiphila]EOS94335.1 hypothetical protein ETR_14146 [Erwinia tracheiphila PSU-1]UIA82456.1 zinc ribbon domain-containing protein [Erwinia tracheiphila]UIA89290.1 zinc ribbon domain-containing protein [Erwinia tracheiphila]UIA91045.1 zinc ribbon domain-containing protein [Erwinia tracheiphila]
MSNVCPVCQNLLSMHEGLFHCSCCDNTFIALPFCPDCAKPLQVLKACGAVDYFCAEEHGLISKKRVQYLPRP